LPGEVRDDILVPTIVSFQFALVAEEKAEAEAEIKIEEAEEMGGLTIDDTSEFVRGITLEAKPGPRVIVIPTVRATSTARDSPEADTMDEDLPEELETGEISLKEEEEMQAALIALENVYDDDDQDIKKEPEDDFEVSIKP
jgi:U4/U6.U5 tri-snRNP-associated protein 1